MFWPVCASPCVLNASAALQGAYITPFFTEVVRAIRAQRDEAYVSKIVCYLHIVPLNPHPPPWLAPYLHHFYFTSPQPIKPKEASDSDFIIEDVMLWPVCASPCVLNVSAVLQGAYITVGFYVSIIFLVRFEQVLEHSETLFLLVNDRHLLEPGHATAD